MLTFVNVIDSRLLNRKDKCRNFNVFFKNWPTPASFSFIFGLFQTNIITILQQIYVKNVHPVYGAGIRTHDLWNVSLFPLPLEISMLAASSSAAAHFSSKEMLKYNCFSICFFFSLLELLIQKLAFVFYLQYLITIPSCQTD